jgi:hypothetical protein
VIEQAPSRLVEVPGLGPKRTGMITAAWAEQQAIKGVMVFLQGVGVSTSLGVRIYKTYRDEAISMNWRGRPLESHEVIVELIGATTTQTGLRVRAELDRGRYPLGTKVGDEELAAVPLVRHGFHGEWNYTLHPAAERRHSAR